MFTNIQKKKSFIRLSMILRTSGTTRTARIHTTITKHLMKFALQHNNRLQVLQFWLTKVLSAPSTASTLTAGGLPAAFSSLFGRRSLRFEPCTVENSNFL